MALVKNRANPTPVIPFDARKAANAAVGGVGDTAAE